MSEATLTVREMRSRLVEKATSNPEFRAQLISDPKTAIKDELEMAIPPNFTIKVHEDSRTPPTWYWRRRRRSPSRIWRPRPAGPSTSGMPHMATTRASTRRLPSGTTLVAQPISAARSITLTDGVPQPRGRSRSLRLHG